MPPMVLTSPIWPNLKRPIRLTIRSAAYQIPDDNELRSSRNDRLLRVCRQQHVAGSAFGSEQSVGSAIDELNFSLLIQKNPHEQPLAAHPRS